MKPEADELTDPIACEHDTASPAGASDTCATSEAGAPTRKHRRGSIRLRLAFLVFACVLPVWIAAGFLIYYNYQSRRALTEQRMLKTARALTMVIDRELANIEASLSALATFPWLVSHDLPAFHRQALAVLDGYPGGFIVLADARGQQLVNTFRPFGASLPKRNLPDAVRQVYATGKPLISGVFRGASSGRLQISVDVPVSHDGRVAYDLAMTVPIDHFAKILLQQQLPSEWLGRIFDRNQVMIARTRLADQFVGKPAGLGLAQRMRDATEGTAETINLENVLTFNGFIRSATSGWTVAIGVPKAIMMADIWRWMWWAIVGTALLSLTGVMLALPIGRSVERIESGSRRLGAIVESFDDGIAAFGLDGTIESWNRGAERLLGYSAPEIVGRHISVLVPDDELNGLEDRLRRVRNGEVIEQHRTTRKHKNGSAIPVDLKICPIFDQLGTVVAASGIVRDITERKQAEDQLQATANRLHAILDNAPVGIVVRTPDYSFVETNAAFQRMIGCSGEDMKHLDLKTLTHPDDIAFSEDMADRLMQGKSKNTDYEKRYVLKDGRTIWVRAIGARLDDKHKISILEDISERKRTEASIAERHRLAALVAEVGTAITGAETMRQGLQRCVEILVHNLDAAFARVWTLNDQEKVLELHASAGMYTHIDGGHARVPLGQFKIGRIAESGEPHLTNSVQEDSWVGDPEWARREAMVAFAGYPLKVEEHVLGVVAAFARQPLTEATLQAFASVANNIALFIRRKRAEEALNKSEERYRLLFENNLAGVFQTTSEGRFLGCNQAVAKILGFDSPQEVLAHCVLDFYSAEERAVFLEKLKADGYLTNFETRLRHKDGSPLWLIANATRNFQSAGGSDIIDGTFVNITQRKQAEEDIRASAARYRELFENVSDIVYTTGLDTRLTFLNRVGQRILGYSAEEAVQLNLEQIVVAKHWGIIQRWRERLLAGERDLTTEVEVTTKDGRQMRLEMKPSLIYKEGKPVGVQSIARDITGRDAVEMELRNAQKLESVGRLASGIAHEINTPVQFIGDNTRFLQESFDGLRSLLTKYKQLRDAVDSGTVSPELLANVRDVEETSDCDYLLEEIPKALVQTLDGVTRVASIVRAMKEFAHPEGNEIAAADINRALLSTLTVARNELKYVAEVETEFGDLPHVVCNIGDINQVFLNLLVNAAHAIADNTKGNGERGKIRVRTVPEGATVLITVSDTGCGIPEANRTKIFDPFFTTKEVGRGTGQGLAIARSVIVERHKGTLNFESEFGKGTTFYVRLPVDPGKCSEEAKGPRGEYSL